MSINSNKKAQSLVEYAIAAMVLTIIATCAIGYFGAPIQNAINGIQNEDSSDSLGKSYCEDRDGSYTSSTKTCTIP